MCTEHWENRNTRRKACPCANWPTTNAKRSGPGSNPRLQVWARRLSACQIPLLQSCTHFTSFPRVLHVCVHIILIRMIILTAPHNEYKLRCLSFTVCFDTSGILFSRASSFLFLIYSLLSMFLYVAIINVYLTLTPLNILFLDLIKRAGRDSSVGRATRYRTDGPWIKSRWGRDFPYPSRPALRPTKPPIKRVPGRSRG